MTTRTWSSASETSIIETVCNVCICPCPDIHLPIVRHQKYERMPEDGMVVRVTVSMIRDLLHLTIVAALPSLVTHNGWSHRHTSHVTPWHRDTGHWGSGLGLTSGHTQSPDQTCAAADVTPEHGNIIVMILSHCFLIIFCLIFLIFPIVTCTAHDVMLMSHKSSKLLYFSSVTKVGSRHK